MLSVPSKTSFWKRAAEQNCLALLEHCNSFLKLSKIHAHVLKTGLQTNPFVLTRFASTASDLNAIDYASGFIFGADAKTHLYDTFLYNVVIRAYAQSGHCKHDALFYYKNMVKDCIFPNKFTYPFVLKACAGIGDLVLGQSVHGSVVKFGFFDDIHVLNTMVHMYCCCSGGIEMGRKVFDEMPHCDSVSWSAMIGGYARLGMSREAVGLFREMQGAGVRADGITMVSVLSACASLGAIEVGKWVASCVEKGNVSRTLELCNAMIDMFAKCGEVDEALRLFRNMSEKDIVSWTCLIDGMAMHGRGSEAVALFEEMVSSEIVPDDVAFIGLLTACSHSGLVEEGKRYFDLMSRKFKILPRIEHYGCMVDLLSRAGLFKDALDFVERMPIDPNPVIFRALISACRAHGELKLSESITESLVKQEPMLESNYVLLSNIYAKMLKWEKKKTIREAMGKKGIRKIPGSTMIEMDNKIYEFVAGDKDHPDHREIHEMLDEMTKKLRSAGFSATTNEVLLDIDEEDKEDALNRHSEKLAIAFALLRTPPGTPIRIVKNLRVCEDCHEATKFISKIYGREIVVRDRNRFHHFKDGLCSCKGFW